jgi:hypothetical protein
LIELPSLSAPLEPAMKPAFRPANIEAPHGTAWSVPELIFASFLFIAWVLPAEPVDGGSPSSDSGHRVTDVVDHVAIRR